MNGTGLSPVIRTMATDTMAAKDYSPTYGNRAMNRARLTAAVTAC